MKSIRLTRDIRNSIARSVMAAWDAVNPPVSDAIFKQYVEERLCKVPESIAREYTEYFRWKRDLYVVVDGMRFYYEHYGSPIMSGGGQDFHVTDGKWKKKFASYRDATETRRAVRAKFKAEMIAIVGAVNTTNQLIEAWPEMEAHLPAHIHDPSKIQLPAVRIDDLNAQLRGP